MVGEDANGKHHRRACAPPGSRRHAFWIAPGITNEEKRLAAALDAAEVIVEV